LSTKGVGSGGDQTLDLEAPFPLGWGEAQEVQDELTQDGEVLSGVIGTGAHLVIAKDHVHAPVQTVFDAPVLADGLIHSLRVGRQAADVETVLNGGFSLDRPLAGDHRERLQVWPALGRVQAVELVEDVAAPDFQPAMVFLDDFVKLVWRLAWRRREGADKIANRFGQGGLIVLDRQDIVGPPIDEWLAQCWAACPWRRW
jgi:hypothetical protein